MADNTTMDWFPITVKFRGKCVECGRDNFRTCTLVEIHKSHQASKLLCKKGGSRNLCIS